MAAGVPCVAASALLATGEALSQTRAFILDDQSARSKWLEQYGGDRCVCVRSAAARRSSWALRRGALLADLLNLVDVMDSREILALHSSCVADRAIGRRMS